MMVSLPLTIALGLLLIGLSLPVVSAAVTGWLHELPARITDAVAAFRPVP
jgi:flagellar biosynthesis protein FliR